MLNSAPYYVQANGQTEPSNNTLIKLIKKVIEDNVRRWHEVFSKALWAHHISRQVATKVTPFELKYEHEVVFPVELNLNAYRFICCYVSRYDDDIENTKLKLPWPTTRK